jgi:sugar phosphate isomerase/epimerase
VELAFGPHDFERHALWRPGGPAGLRSQAEAAGVSLPSVYVGYLLDFPLTHPDTVLRQRSASTVDRLIEVAAEAGATTLVLPFLGKAELRLPADVERLAEGLSPLAEKATRFQAALALHTVQPAAESLTLLSRLGPPSLKLAYDPVAALALDRDPVAEWRLFGEAVLQVRVGERRGSARPVATGTGQQRLAAIIAEWAGHPTIWGVVDSAPGDDPRSGVKAALAFLREAAPRERP